MTGLLHRRLVRALLVAVVAVLALFLLPAAARAAAAPVGGAGSQYFLSDSLGGVADRVFTYGDPGDVVYFGDWDGNGTDTPLIRRGNWFYLRNSASTGVADLVFPYGDPGDVVLVGDWDGNGTDTLAVRRGGQYFLKNSLSTGAADQVVAYGDPGDVVLVGDWDGNRTDTLAVRRGGQYFLSNRLGSGTAESVIGYGDPLDTAFAGDWNGDGRDTLGIRRPAAGERGPFALPVATGSAQQLITVAVPSASSTVGTLTAWQLGPGGWTVALGPVTAHVGSQGVGVASETSTRTPAGTFTLTEAFGRTPNPGTALPYRVVDRSDWWVSDVRSPLYNRYARCAPGTCPFDERAGEDLGAAGAVYDDAVVIDYNREGRPGAGSAFFLHITNGAPTAGCVAVDRGSVVALLRWLDPAEAPLIAIGVG